MKRPTLVKLAVLAACLGLLAWWYWPFEWWPVIQTPRTTAASEG